MNKRMIDQIKEVVGPEETGEENQAVPTEQADPTGGVGQALDFKQMLIDRVDGFVAFSEQQIADHKAIKAWLVNDPAAGRIVETLFRLVQSVGAGVQQRYIN